ncbi:hypothetical protein BY458DRAFT_584910 [Sporodiniella umbellata]|nr:hypothetical protein BY458DRAFT_584910 [Sporodiniella umbellata]
MSSLHLPSFIYDSKKGKSKSPEGAVLERTASRGTLSKMKRLGSKLIRNKTVKESAHRPPPLDLKVCEEANYSQISLAVSSIASSVDDHVTTPTTADYFKHTFNLTQDANKEPQSSISIIEPNTEEDKGKTKPEADEGSDTDTMDKSSVVEDLLSDLSLARYHSAAALQQVDQEIEQEFYENHLNMLETLNSYPKLFF